jgi:hypothetical protein
MFVTFPASDEQVDRFISIGVLNRVFMKRVPEINTYSQLPIKKKHFQNTQILKRFF